MRALPSTQDFPIVGIGASAGGLQALLAFFQNTAPDLSMAVVVVMHLSPTHESNASALIQARTSMKVLEVTQATHIEARHVYVIAPNKQLEMIDGYLRVKERAPLSGWPIAIDVFFRTLALAHQSRAVAILLSGTGRDGVAGLRAIKDNGGMVFAQDPDDAEFAGMPRAAIETGAVDFVLPVADMPCRLAALWNSARQISLPPETGEHAALAGADGRASSGADEESLRDIISILRKRTGHDFTKYKRATVLRRIERRLQVRQKTSLTQYCALLREDRSESDALLRDMLIGVTQFFRDPEAFELLAREVLPQMFGGDEPNAVRRIWCAGCSTGEEAYSLGILMTEHIGRSGTGCDFQLFGSDIDERAIAVARAGVYGAALVRDLSSTRLAEHFIREEGRYRIKKSIRDKILFANQNLLRDPPFSALDLISCRNLLIYLNREAHAAVLEMFHFVLKPGGFLFLGSSESAEALTEFFVPVDKKHRIYRAKTASRLPRSSIPMRTPHMATTAVSYPERSASDKPSFAGVHQRVLAEYAPPSVLIDQQSNIVHLSEGSHQFLRHVAGEPSRNLIALVEPELRLELRAAIFNAIQSGKSVETRGIRFERGTKVFIVNIVVRPFYDASTLADFILVLFHKIEQAVEEARSADIVLAPDAIVTGLELELQRTRVQLQDTIEHSETSTEELKAANEELQAINEELRSATEELETSKEELQSVNEELMTVNVELKNKVEETGKVNDDLQNLIASTDLATIFVDRDMRIKRYTPHACDLFNLIASDIGRPLHDITHKLRYPELAKDAAATFGSLRPVEREVASEDGRWLIARLLPYRTGHDRIDGAVLTFIDITTRRNAEERARAGEERMRLVADSTKDYAIITMDRDGLITSFNSGAERMFGYREEDILGRSDELIFTPEDRAAGVPPDEKRRARDEGRAEDERWHLRKDGSRFFCSGVMTPLLDNQLNGYAKIGRGLTGRQEAEKGRAEQLQREKKRSSQAQLDNAQKDQFSAIMSHELKNPLNLIHMHAEVLMRQPAVNAAPPLQKAVTAIRSATISQSKIINDLLDLSRVSTEKMELNRTRVDLCALVGMIVDAIGTGPAGPKLVVQLPNDRGVTVYADEVRLEQVVWNLLSNAVKFTPPEGTVSIDMKADKEAAHLCVRDTGQGIRAEALPTIFDIFKQDTVNNFRGSKGLGIGLALVQQIVQLHGGQVRAESPGPGQGASFTVTLPLAPELPGHNDIKAPQARALENLRVLLVDDNDDALTVFTMLLEMDGAKVAASNSAREALGMLDSASFDLVLSDIHMPDMDGLSFIMEIRKHPGYHAVPAIAITGMGRQQDIDEALAAGYSGYLGKPVDMTDLARQVERLLGNPSERRQSAVRHHDEKEKT
ncbi:chemotaxis protein CheB [Massilia sp. CCM 9210]|uniref:chemotaxis protein CheB n=1 Tax=Massilia scottii TaxID=3057166 RepID=UPI002796CEFB|nr:chemotaxis protein CheB [Massilia sp. CCM 9210]MDQ1816310.1 chemotaxis protein CheB [Massilia sp. CCM 9210]